MGNTAIVGELAWDYIMLTPQVTYYRIADRKELCNRYLRHFFDGAAFQTVLDKLSGGGTRSYLGIVGQHALPVALPPPEEQRAIAEALSDVHALINALDALITKKRHIKQGTMQQLLTGKKRLSGYQSKNTTLIQTEAGTFPSDWELKALGNATSKIGSGITPTGGSSVYRASGRPFMRSQNVGWGDLRLSEIAFLDEATHATFLASEIENQDVFLNISGASIGRSAIADERVVNGNVNQHVCIIRCIQDQLVPKFLNFVLLSDYGQRKIDSFQAGGNREGLNFGQIKSFDIPLPKVSEQKAIAAVLSDMDAEITALEQKRDKTKLIKQGMMQELLTGKTRLI